MLNLAFPEVTAWLLGMVQACNAVRLGFIASSAERARLTGFAVAERLAASGAVWHPARQEVRWPGGARVVFLSGQRPERLRAHRWAAALVAPAVSERPEVLERVWLCVTPCGAAEVIHVGAEVESRAALAELQREAA